MIARRCSEWHWKIAHRRGVHHRKCVPIIIFSAQNYDGASKKVFSPSNDRSILFSNAVPIALGGGGTLYLIAVHARKCLQIVIRGMMCAAQSASFCSNESPPLSMLFLTFATMMQRSFQNTCTLRTALLAQCHFSCKFCTARQRYYERPTEYTTCALSSIDTPPPTFRNTLD